MKRALAQGAAVVWLLGSLGGGCTSDLRLSLAGKDCTADGACADGYACNTARKCVLPSELSPDGGDVSAGAGGAMGLGGQSGQGGQAGSVALGGSGGAPPGGAAGNAGVAGSGGGSVDPVDPDAGYTDLADADGGCIATTVFRDDDGDGVGESGDALVACPGPGWATLAGDCRDDLPDVFPGQTQFFAEPYLEPAAPAGAGGVSFDYDCDSLEQPDPTNATLDPAPTCPALVLGCEGSGFLPADDPPREGTGLEARCGSTSRRTCLVEGGLSCITEDTVVGAILTFRCN